MTSKYAIYLTNKLEKFVISSLEHLYETTTNKRYAQRWTSHYLCNLPLNPGILPSLCLQVSDPWILQMKIFQPNSKSVSRRMQIITYTMLPIIEVNLLIINLIPLSTLLFGYQSFWKYLTLVNKRLTRHKIPHSTSSKTSSK